MKESEWSRVFYPTDRHSSTFIHPGASESTGAGEGAEGERDEAKCFGKLQSLL